jgi:hypothetical protein
LSDDPRLRGIPAAAPDENRANERDQRLADLTARLRADNQRLAQRADAHFVNTEFSAPDDDQVQKRRSRFWELIHMLTNRERPDTERAAAHGSFPTHDHGNARTAASSAVERAALAAIAEALATPDISRDLAALQSLAEPHPYEPAKRAKRPLPLFEEGAFPAFVAPFKDVDDLNEGNDTDWQEVKAEALRLLQMQLLDSSASHLVEHVKALQQGQKQMADAIALIDSRLRQIEADMRAGRSEV